MADKSERTLRYEKKNPEVVDEGTEDVISEKEEETSEEGVSITEEATTGEMLIQLDVDETPKVENLSELQKMMEFFNKRDLLNEMKAAEDRKKAEEDRAKAEERSIEDRKKAEEDRAKAEERSIEDRKKAEENTKLIIENTNEKIQETRKELNNKIEVVIKNTEDTKRELKENLQKCKEEIENKFAQAINDTNSSVQKVKENVYELSEEVAEIKSQIVPKIDINNKMIQTQQILEEQIVKSKMDMSQEVCKLENRVDLKFNDQGEKLKLLEENVKIKCESTNNSITLSALQDITWPTNNGQAIKFYEKGDFNPKQFIKYANRSTSHIRDVNKFKNCICSMMGGNAKKWFGCVQDKFEDFVGFERLFLDRYWDKQAQGRIRNELMNGKFKGYGRRNDYAENIINEVTQLEPEVSEEEIVEHLSNHFCQDIINRVALENINTISELSKLLRRTDAVNMDERANRPSYNNATRTFNNYSGGQRESNNQRTYHNNGNDNRNNQDNRYNRYERSGNYNQNNNNYGRNENNFENRRGGYNNFNTNNRDSQDDRNAGYNTNRNNFGRGNYYGNNRNYNQGYRGRFQRGGRYESNWRSYDNRTNDQNNQQGGDERFPNRTSANTENRPINSVTINRTPAVEEETSSPQDFQ